MNQAVNIAEFKACLNCKFSSKTAAKICPRCRKHRLWTPNGIRLKGVLQIALGIMIAGFALLFILIEDSTRRAGSQERNFLIISAMVIVIGAGFFGCLSGGWKLLTGKSNPKLMSAVLNIVFFLLLFLITYVEFYGI